MRVPFEREEIERFRDVVSNRLGLACDESTLDQLATLLRSRMLALGCQSISSYIGRVVSSDPPPNELRVLAESLTVAETYFFRHFDHFRAIVEVILPERIRAQTSQRRLRILSAGCSTGEEPYTVAILVREHFPNLASWDVEIRGIDVNASSITKAKQAHYSEWSLRETPDRLRQRYFRQEGKDFVLDDAIRSMVFFEERNLLHEDPTFWRPAALDVVFCRNVSMYFTPGAMRDAITRPARALAPGGFLLLGPAETLRGISQVFHLRHSHDAFYYQLKTLDEMREVPTVPRAQVSVPQAAPLLSEVMVDASWLDAIFRASDRIAALSQRAATAQSGSVGTTPTRPAETALRPSYDLVHATELFRQEKFRDAIDVLRSLPHEAQADTDAQLLLAVVLAQKGEVAECEQVCRRVLSLDELNAGAQYLMALCREHAGDRHAAWEHDQTATYLDATFAMPHLHMGHLARGWDQLEAARREFNQALILLAREDASRILLFGGGFNREALVQLCRAELHGKRDLP